jgi:hypothetical protein
MKLQHLTNFSILLFALVALPLPASAAKGDRCDLSDGWQFLEVGQSKHVGVFLIRFDGADFKKEDPDQYQISVKQEGVDALLANHRLVIQHQSIQIKTSCGDLTIGADRYSGGAVRFNLSLF